ncbi:MAG: hypothetical protein GWN62_07140, partial [Aliifodinibius sp.]|nr:hypothetical protein [Fodinibius sp.]
MFLKTTGIIEKIISDKDSSDTDSELTDILNQYKQAGPSETQTESEAFDLTGAEEIPITEPASDVPIQPEQQDATTLEQPQY